MRGLRARFAELWAARRAEAQALVEAARAGGKIFMVNNTANFRDQAKSALELVKTIGEVQHVQCHMGCAMGGMFDSAERATWTAPVGVAGEAGEAGLVYVTGCDNHRVQVWGGR